MPQFYFDADVLAASLAELMASLFAAAVALSFRRAFPRADLVSFGSAWGLAAAFAAVSLVGNTQTWSPAGIAALRAVGRSAAFLQAALLLIGAHRLVRPGGAPAWLLQAAFLAPLLGTGSALLSALALPIAWTILLRALPSFTVGAASLAAAGWIWRGRRGQPDLGARLMFAALSLYGALKAFSPATLSQLGLLQGAYAGAALFLGFALAPAAFALGSVVSLLEDRERTLAVERDRMRVSEEKFAKLFRSSPDAILVTRPRAGGLIVDVNHAFEGLTGYTAAEAVGKTAVELGLLADPENRLALLREWEAGGRIRDRELQVLDRSGRRATVTVSAEDLEIGLEPHMIIVVRDITERRSAEQRLRESEERLRLALEAAGMGIWEWNPATEAFEWSEQVRHIVGFEPDPQAPSRSYLERVQPDRRDDLARLIRETLSGAREGFSHEHRVRGDDGVRRWVETRAKLFRPPRGEAVLRGTLVGISERKQAEEALRESEERLRRISAATFEGIGFSENGVVIDANEQLARMLGYTLEELIGRPIRDVVAPDDRARVQEAMGRQHSGAYEHLAVRKDGSVFPVEARGHALEVEGRTLRVAAIRDLSEQAELLERLRLIGRATNDAVWDWDLKSGALWWSQGIHTLFGYGQQELGPTLAWRSERIHGDERERVTAGLQAAIREGRQAWSDEYRFQRSDGSYADVLDRGFVLRGPGGVPARMLGAMLDISERKQAQERLRRSERLAAVGAVVAGVAHEVRTPLFSISATLDAFEGHLEAPDEQRQFLSLLRSQVQRLGGLMRDLLDYGRPQGLRLARGSLQGVIQRALRSCAHQAEEAGVAVQEDLGAAHSELERDPERLEQVFQNLLSNAIHHAPRGSVVRVAVTRNPGPDAGLACCVEDEGPGLRDEDLPRVFEPFFSRRKGGTGLGLAIVQRIVEEHGGSVRAANRPGGGAAFTVFLPSPRARAA